MISEKDRSSPRFRSAHRWRSRDADFRDRRERVYRRGIWSRLRAGHELLCLTRRANELAARVGGAAGVQALLGDLAQPDRWRADLQRFAPDCCIHLAWEGLPDYSPERCQQNLDFGRGLIDALERSAKVEPRGRGRKLLGIRRRRRCGRGIAGAGRNAACSPSAKHELRARCATAGIAYRWARIFFAYGPGQRETSLIPQCRAAFAAGKAPDIRQPRVAQDFIYVEDVARGLLALAEARRGIGRSTTSAPERPRRSETWPTSSRANAAARRRSRTLSFDSGFWADTRKMTASTGWRAQTTARRWHRTRLAGVRGGMSDIRQAVILCGGLGTRLRPYTDRLPKPMIPVNGRPFLGISGRATARAGHPQHRPAHRLSRRTDRGPFRRWPPLRRRHRLFARSGRMGHRPPHLAGARAIAAALPLALFRQLRAVRSRQAARFPSGARPAAQPDALRQGDRQYPRRRRRHRPTIRFQPLRPRTSTMSRSATCWSSATPSLPLDRSRPTSASPAFFGGLPNAPRWRGWSAATATTASPTRSGGKSPRNTCASSASC